MSTKLQEFMYCIYGAFLLPLVSEKVRPGALIETDWLPAWQWDTNPRFKSFEGYAWDLLDAVDPERCADEMGGASILVGDLVDKVDFGLDLTLPQFGFGLDVALNASRTAKLTLGGVRARTFKRGFCGDELRAELKRLEQKRDPRWIWVKGDFLVTESYYTSDVHFEFKDTGGLSAKAELQDVLTPAAGLELKWTDEYNLTLKGTSSVPFAVRGNKV